MLICFYLLLLNFPSFSVQVYQEISCTNERGKCKNVNDGCSGNFLPGKCPTQSKNIKCCVDVYQEIACSNVDGTCVRISEGCNGQFVSGKCPTQPNNVKCCVHTSQAEHEDELIEGDIHIPDFSSDSSGIQGYRENNALKVREPIPWPYGIIPFTISDQFNDNEMISIKDMIKEIQNVSCVHFKRHNKETTYMMITRGSIHKPCNCFVGYEDTGARKMRLHSHCLNKNGILHELMHALGFLHEHNRQDRQKYVKIILENVKDEHVDDLKYPRQFLEKVLIGIEYDFNSVTHYPSNVFAFNESLTTIESKSGQEIKANGLSEKDILKINRFYQFECRKSGRNLSTAIDEMSTIFIRATEEVVINTSHHPQIYQESACRNQGGKCKNVMEDCHGSFLPGKCPTQANNIKCCVGAGVQRSSGGDCYSGNKYDTTLDKIIGHAGRCQNSVHDRGNVYQGKVGSSCMGITPQRGYENRDKFSDCSNYNGHPADFVKWCFERNPSNFETGATSIYKAIYFTVCAHLEQPAFYVCADISVTSGPAKARMYLQNLGSPGSNMKNYAKRLNQMHRELYQREGGSNLNVWLNRANARDRFIESC